MMMDVNTIGQMLRDSKMTGNLNRQSLSAGLGLGGGRGAPGFMTGPGQASGIPGLGTGNSATGFQDQVAIAMAQAELSAQSAMSSGAVNQETARSLAQIQAMSMHNEMLTGLINPEQGGANNAVSLVGRANIEAAMVNSGGHFGNLLGQRGGRPVLDSGRKLSPSEMSSLQQKVRGLKSGPFRKSAAPAENLAEPAEAKEANLRMPYGLTRPLRPEETAASIAADLDYWIEDPLKGLDQTQLAQAAAANRAAGQTASASTAEARAAATTQNQATGALNSESEILAAQKKDAASNLENDFTREELGKLVDKVSLALGLDRNLVMAVIKTESNFNHKAVSRAGAKGLMQLMPGTAKDLGVADPFNPVENVWAGARYLKQMLDRHGGNINKALASYNWGPGNFDRYGKSGKMPNETRRYISIVNQHLASFKRADTDQA